jgi:hypothetical protein
MTDFFIVLILDGGGAETIRNDTMNYFLLLAFFWPFVVALVYPAGCIEQRFFEGPSLRFLVIGDWGVGDESQRMVAHSFLSL